MLSENHPLRNGDIANVAGVNGRFDAVLLPIVVMDDQLIPTPEVALSTVIIFFFTSGYVRNSTFFEFGSGFVRVDTGFKMILEAGRGAVNVLANGASEGCQVGCVVALFVHL